MGLQNETEEQENKVMVCPKCGKPIKRQTNNRWCFVCIWEHGWEPYSLYLEAQLNEREYEYRMQGAMLSNEIVELQERLEDLAVNYNIISDKDYE